MKILPVHSTSSSHNFHVAEYCAVLLPKRSFTLKATYAFDFRDYCVDIIVLAIGNLVINKVLQFGSQTKETSFLKVFKYNESIGQLILKDASLEFNEIGFVVGHILESIKKNRDRKIEEQIRFFMDGILGSGTIYSAPAKKFTSLMLKQNILNSWTYEYKGFWIFKTVKVSITREAEESLSEKLRQVNEQRRLEKISNKPYNEFLQNLTNIVSEELLRREQTGD